MIGCGVPDLLVGYRGVNYLVEVKNPKNQYGKKGFNECQKRFNERWHGEITIVRTIDDVIGLVNRWNDTPAEALNAVA